MGCFKILKEKEKLFTYPLFYFLFKQRWKISNTKKSP